MKLNRLKKVRCNSHGFLSKCVQKKLDAKALEITQKPTIGNFDQDLVNNWYTNLKQHNKSIVLMK